MLGENTLYIHTNKKDGLLLWVNAKRRQSCVYTVLLITEIDFGDNRRAVAHQMTLYTEDNSAECVQTKVFI